MFTKYYIIHVCSCVLFIGCGAAAVPEAHAHCENTNDLQSQTIQPGGATDCDAFESSVSQNSDSNRPEPLRLRLSTVGPIEMPYTIEEIMQKLRSTSQVKEYEVDGSHRLLTQINIDPIKMAHYTIRRLDDVILRIKNTRAGILSTH